MEHQWLPYDGTARAPFWKPQGLLQWLRQEMSLELDSSRLIDSHEWDKLGCRTPNRPVYIGPVCPDTTSGCEEEGELLHMLCYVRGDSKDKMSLSRYYGWNVGDEDWASGPGSSLLLHKTFFSRSDSSVLFILCELNFLQPEYPWVFWGLIINFGGAVVSLSPAVEM